MHIAFKSGIIKTNISHNFPIFFSYEYIDEKYNNKKEFIYNHNFSDQATILRKLKLHDVNRYKIKQCRNTFNLLHD